MKISFGQQLSQKQSQTLAPRMIQSMEILQMPLAALEERIDQELSENPVLERAETNEEFETFTEDETDKNKPESETDVEQKELVIDADQNNTDDFERLLNLNNDHPDHFDGPKISSNRMTEMGDRQHDLLANVVDRNDTLQDHLMNQLAELDLDPKLFKMCERIVSSLTAEDGGYLRVGLLDLIPGGPDPEKLSLPKTPSQQCKHLIQPELRRETCRNVCCCNCTMRSQI